MKESLKDSLYFTMMLLMIPILFFCASCSTTVSIVNTHGAASDVVDTEQKSDADVSPELSIPVGI